MIRVGYKLINDDDDDDENENDNDDDDEYDDYGDYENSSRNWLVR